MAEVRGLYKDVGKYSWREKKSTMHVKLKNVISSLHLFVGLIYLFIWYNWFHEYTYFQLLSTLCVLSSVRQQGLLLRASTRARADAGKVSQHGDSAHYDLFLETK